MWSAENKASLLSSTKRANVLPGDSAIETALGQSDVVTSILRAIGAGDPKHACKTADAWCRGKKALHAACEGDEGAWKHLADSLFPSATSVMQPREPNGTDKDYAILHNIWKQEGGKGLSKTRWEDIIEKKLSSFERQRVRELLELARDNGPGTGLPNIMVLPAPQNFQKVSACAMLKNLATQ